MGRRAALLLAALFTVAAGVALFAPAPALAHFGLDSGSIAPGENWTMTLMMQRTMAYHCHPHPWMEGVVEILPSTVDHEPRTHVVRIVEPGPDPQSWGYEPARLEVMAFDTVMWVNEGTAVHTVTEMDDHQDEGHGDDHAAPGPGSLAILAAILAGLVLARRAAR